MKKKIKKIFINFKNLNKEIDSEQKKLYDRLQNLELSHNRKIKLLEEIQKFLKNPLKFSLEDYAKMRKKLDAEINGPLRVKIKTKRKPELAIIPTRKNNIFNTYFKDQTQDD